MHTARASPCPTIGLGRFLVGQGLAPAVSNQENFKNGYGSRGSAPAVSNLFIFGEGMIFV